MKILFFGTRQHGLETLRNILEKGYQVCAVTTEEYGMDHVSSEDFRKVCTENNIHFYKNDNIENDHWANIYREYKADLGICVGWRRIIREKILKTTRHGFIGPHAADLPKYRGFAASHYSILNGDPYCGFSIMRFKAGAADNGDICGRFRVPITESTTIKDILDESRPLIIKNIIKTIEDIKNDMLTPVAQDETRAVYSYPRVPDDGEIDWTKSAVEINRLIRAVTRPYPGAFTFIGNRKLFVWKAHVLHHSPQFVGVHGHIVHIDNEAGVLTGNGMLIIDECQFEDEVSTFVPASIFKTYRLRLGMNHSKNIQDLMNRVKFLEKELDELKKTITNSFTPGKMSGNCE